MLATIKRKLAFVAAVVAAAMAAPAAASAQTALPPVPFGATQAFASTNGSTPITAPVLRGFAGSLNWTPAGAAIACSYSANYVVTPAGYGFVQGVSFSPVPCPTSIPGCFATVTSAPPPNDTWGRRLISWPGPAAPTPGRYDVVNVALQIVFTGTCAGLPTGWPFVWTGTLWFRVGPAGGGPVSSTSLAAPKDVLTSPAFGPSAPTAWAPTVVPGQPVLYVL